MMDVMIGIITNTTIPPPDEDDKDDEDDDTLITTNITVLELLFAYGMGSSRGCSGLHPKHKLHEGKTPKLNTLRIRNCTIKMLTPLIPHPKALATISKGNLSHTNASSKRRMRITVKMIEQQEAIETQP